MSIKHHVSLYLYGSEYNTPTTLAWPAPLPPATLEGDRNTTLLNLSWTGAYKPISIRGGSIIVTRQSGGEIFRLELRRGLFPPGARGRLAFEAKGFTGANQLYDIEVYIELDHTGDLGTDIQAGSFVGKFSRNFDRQAITDLSRRQPLSSRKGHKMSVSTSLVVDVVCGPTKRVFSRCLPISMLFNPPSSTRTTWKHTLQTRRRRTRPSQWHPTSTTTQTRRPTSSPRHTSRPTRDSKPLDSSTRPFGLFNTVMRRTLLSFAGLVPDRLPSHLFVRPSKLASTIKTAKLVLARTS